MYYYVFDTLIPGIFSFVLYNCQYYKIRSFHNDLLLNPSVCTRAFHVTPWTFLKKLNGIVAF